jgi:hypothetical protein
MCGPSHPLTPPGTGYEREHEQRDDVSMRTAPGIGQRHGG